MARNLFDWLDRKCNRYDRDADPETLERHRHRRFRKYRRKFPGIENGFLQNIEDVKQYQNAQALQQLRPHHMFMYKTRSCAYAVERVTKHIPDGAKQITVRVIGYVAINTDSIDFRYKWTTLQIHAVGSRLRVKLKQLHQTHRPRFSTIEELVDARLKALKARTPLSEWGAAIILRDIDVHNDFKQNLDLIRYIE